MHATAQVASLTFEGIIAELMGQGTIAGYSTLEELKSAEIGVELFVQEDGIEEDGRLRQLSGVALSRGITYSQLKDQLHLELIKRLQSQLQLMAQKSGLGGHFTNLLSEIITS